VRAVESLVRRAARRARSPGPRASFRDGQRGAPLHAGPRRSNEGYLLLRRTRRKVSLFPETALARILNRRRFPSFPGPGAETSRGSILSGRGRIDRRSVPADRFAVHAANLTVEARPDVRDPHGRRTRVLGDPTRPPLTRRPLDIPRVSPRLSTKLRFRIAPEPATRPPAARPTPRAPAPRPPGCASPPAGVARRRARRGP